MTTANTMMRVRTTTKNRLRAIATRKRWPLVEAIDAAVEQLEKSEGSKGTRPVRKPSLAGT